jgi:starvation-inducible DNA-binding protein
VDTIAERVTALGGTALGTARMAGSASRLSEYPEDVSAGRDSLKTLTERYAALASTTRAAIDTAAKLGDVSTSDIFTEVSRDLDKSLWFLEAHLQG